MSALLHRPCSAPETQKAPTTNKGDGRHHFRRSSALQPVPWGQSMASVTRHQDHRSKRHQSSGGPVYTRPHHFRRNTPGVRGLAPAYKLAAGVQCGVYIMATHPTTIAQASPKKQHGGTAGVSGPSRAVDTGCTKTARDGRLRRNSAPDMPRLSAFARTVTAERSRIFCEIRFTRETSDNGAQPSEARLRAGYLRQTFHLWQGSDTSEGSGIWHQEERTYTLLRNVEAGRPQSP
jgi:hypothetical protein